MTARGRITVIERYQQGEGLEHPSAATAITRNRSSCGTYSRSCDPRTGGSHEGRYVVTPARSHTRRASSIVSRSP